MRHSQPASFVLLCAITLAASLVSVAALAYVVVLKTGAEFTGTITKEEPDAVTIRSGGVNWTFKREKIGSITKVWTATPGRCW